MEVSLIVGLSGAGKSTVLHVFEDMRLMTANGIPPALVPALAKLCAAPSFHKTRGMAVGIDQHSNAFVDELSEALNQLRHLNMTPRLLYLEATPEELMRRYATTRRPHPLELGNIGLEQAILEESKQLQPVRSMADIILDTSGYSIHDLRRAIQHLHAAPEHSHAMKVNLISFGFKYGVPREADLVFDLRFLPNPYFVSELRPFSGKDAGVADYIFASENAKAFQDNFFSFLTFLLPQFEKEGRYRLTIALGCTGGRHRSVAATERLAQKLQAMDYCVSIEHRHINLV